MRSIHVTLMSLFATACTSLAFATPVPIGTYTMSAQTTTTGIHQSLDQGTLAGTLTFNASSTLVSANLIFTDTTSNKIFSFTSVGPTSTNSSPLLENATISNAMNSALYYAFSIQLPSTPSGAFTLTCGTDCDNDVEINDLDGRGILNEELTGSISPTPEPSSLVLLGTGLVAGFGVMRRRWLRS